MLDAKTFVTLLLAGCCLFAIGSMAGSLEATVPGEPTDVIDVDTESLPLPAAEFNEVKESLQSSGDTTGEQMDAQEPQDDGGSSSEPADSGDTAGGSSSGESSDGGSADQSNEAATQVPTRSLLDYVLPALAAVVTLAAALYKREWLLARLRASLGTDAAPTEESEPDILSIRSPDNEVERLWLEMVSRVDQSSDPSATPRERAEAVARAGLDRDAVQELTDLYESVRYGDRPVTDELVDEASAHLQRSVGESDD